MTHQEYKERIKICNNNNIQFIVGHNYKISYNNVEAESYNGIAKLIKITDNHMEWKCETKFIDICYFIDIDVIEEIKE